MYKILVTGSAGFIGFHLVKKLIENGNKVVGLDCINDYYDINLKYARLEETGIHKENITEGELVQSSKFKNYRFVKLKLEDQKAILQLFEKEKFDKVCNLAAQAGVRYSLINPYAYIDSNIVGFINILEGCRHNAIKHFVYASSSSVYGLNTLLPFSTHQNVDHPISLYAATKKSNELMAHTYSYLYGLPTTGLRFFTVYGPWGRPDMALFLFTRAILEGKPIDIYNNGNMKRDFTYVDDIVEGIVRVLAKIPEGDREWNGICPDPGNSIAPYKLYNIGNNNPIRLNEFIEAIEKALDKKAVKNYLPLQSGDVLGTWADISDLEKEMGYSPKTEIKNGIKQFVIWYDEFYQVHSHKNIQS
jgi:UDP-glucuronate 4-epimerase